MFVFEFSVLRDQWIRAKYERKEFTGEPKNQSIPYTTGDVIHRVCCQSLTSWCTASMNNLLPGEDKHVFLHTCISGNESWPGCHSLINVGQRL